MTDIEIAQSVKYKRIDKIAKKVGIKKDALQFYGNYMAKVELQPKQSKSKLILVTAINPTSAGEGKTTVSIGLADAFSRLKKKVCLALREPSLGPVFGTKGGATGGGRAQIVPMEDINLHFTGDLHAITSANNLLASFIDNHIFQGNELNIDENKIVFRRCVDLNDRALREAIVARGKSGVGRSERFTITAASEIMAILSLSKDIEDLKTRLGNILVAYDKNGKPVYAKQLKVHDAMTILLKEAIKPNLVQTLEGTPALVHCGPFANIAHGCNSIIATRLAMSVADYTITEAGFGADLGAEKFLDVKCRLAGLNPDCVVVVVTARALKLHGGVLKNNLNEENLEAIRIGLGNLTRHISNLQNVYNMKVVVAINRFISDTQAELDLIKNECNKLGVEAVSTEVWGKGSLGAVELAKTVIKMTNTPVKELQFAYKVKDDIKQKITDIATKVYGAKGVNFSKQSLKDIEMIEKINPNLPVVIAKTQYSFSDNALLLGAPTDFEINIDEVELKNGAGFIVAIAGKMMLMPGLGKNPAGANMTISNNKISGLF